MLYFKVGARSASAHGDALIGAPQAKTIEAGFTDILTVLRSWREEESFLRA